MERWNIGFHLYVSKNILPIIPFFQYSSIPLEEFFNPFPHSLVALAEGTPLAHLKPTLPFASTSIENQTHSRRIHRTRDQIHQSSDTDGGPSPNGQIKDLLRQLRNALQDGAPASEDNPGGKEISKTCLHHLIMNQGENLLDPGFDDFRQGLPGKDARFPAPHAGNFNGFVLPNQGSKGASIFYFDLFRFLHRRPKSHRDIARDMASC